MKKISIIYMLLCALGGGLIGFFAGKLYSVLGIIMFCLGICLLVFSMTKIGNLEEERNKDKFNK
ncbi:MAG: hypothetical protein Q4G09_07855 [Clostridia bacterium]|nr:hypothetical protein [Clostridia bacterium]